MILWYHHRRMPYILWEYNRRDGLIEKRSTTMAEQISQRTEGAELSVTQNGSALLMEETSGSIWVLDHVEH
jgi:hypothetical protein